MDTEKDRELDNLVINYFGPDYDLIDDSDDLAPKIEAYNAHSGKAMQETLLDDIEDFLSLGTRLDEAFAQRYDTYFIPALWGSTPQEFLLLVKNMVSDAVQQKP